MATYLNALLPGIAYGNGELQGPGDPGQIVKLTGNDVFALVSESTDVPIGIIGRTNRTKTSPTPGPNDKIMAVIYIGDGIYETDNVSGTINAGDALTVDASTGKLKTAGSGNKIVARALSASDGLVKFLWTNHGTNAPTVQG